MIKQKGAALIIVLVLLTVSLMLGLSSVQSSLVDERLAGNYRATTQAQLRAESAVVAMIDKINNSEVNPENLNGSSFESCAAAWEWLGSSALGELDEESCLSANHPGQACYVSIPSELCGARDGDYIVSRGEVFDGNGGDRYLIARSQVVFVEVEEQGYGFRNLSPLSVLQEMSEFSAPGNTVFDGKKFVPDITVAPTEDKDKMDSSGVNLENGEVDYGVGYGFLDEVISDPSDASLFAKFILDLKSQSDVFGNTFEGDVSGGGNNNTAFGSVSSPAVSFVNGNVTSNGVTGGGVLVINGNFESNGNPGFDGLIIVLGDFLPGNGGGGDDIKGALLIAPYQGKGNPEQKNIDCAEDCEFSKASVHLAQGGGNMDFLYDKDNLDMAYQILSDDAKSRWNAGGGGEASGDINIIIWR